MIVVVDTNVWISALIFSSGEGTVYRAVERAVEIDTLAICPEIQAEIAGILRDRFRWPEAQTDARLAAFLKEALRVTISGKLRVCRDPDDDKFLECAEAAAANLIVTGDKDLLALGIYKQTRIVTPAKYLSL